mgnify:FL=1
MLRQESKKFLMIVLGVLLLSVFGLSIAYAILNVTLNISGSAKVTSADWDISIENVSIVTEGSASVLKQPVVDGTEIKDFNVSLTKPGDAIYITFYVTNNGSIDAKFVNSTLHTVDYGVYKDYMLTYFKVGLTTPEEVNLASGESRMFMYEISWDSMADTLPGNTAPIEINNLGATILYEQK